MELTTMKQQSTSQSLQQPQVHALVTKQSPVTSYQSRRSGTMLPLCLSIITSVLFSNFATAEDQSSANILKIKQEIAHIGDSTPLEPIIEVQPDAMEIEAEDNSIQQEIAKLQALKEQKTAPSSTTNITTVLEKTGSEQIVSNKTNTSIKQEIKQLQTVAEEKSLDVAPVIKKTVTEVAVEPTVAEPLIENSVVEPSVKEIVAEKQATESMLEQTISEKTDNKVPLTEIAVNTEVNKIDIDNTDNKISPTELADKTDVNITDVQNKLSEMETEKPVIDIPTEQTASQPVIENNIKIDEQENVVAQASSQSIFLETMRSVENAPEAYNHYTEIAQRLSIIFHFKTEKNELDSTNKQELARLIDYLNITNTEHIVLMGFADSLGDKAYNSELSLQRAQVIEKELLNNGLNVVTVSGFGSAVPVASNINAAGRSENRRVEVWVY